MKERQYTVEPLLNQQKLPYLQIFFIFFYLFVFVGYLKCAAEIPRCCATLHGISCCLQSNQSIFLCAA